jgi:hypothetical protein
MAETKTVKEKKVYSKNYFVKDFGPIGGLEASAEIDKQLNEQLKDAKAKASDFHVSEKEYALMTEKSKLQIGIKQVSAKKK